MMGLDMFSKLLTLNWRLFLSNLTRFQIVLISGYAFFLLIMLANLLGSALVIIFMENDPRLALEIPWLTPQIYLFILLVFTNSFWVMHFSFTNLRLLNMEENRKLLGFGFPVSKLALYLNMIGFFHPINLIYNLTWMIFLLVQVNYWHQVPVVIVAVLLNYSVIYSIKHRFLKIVEKRFVWVVFTILFLLFLFMQAVALFSENSIEVIARVLPDLLTLNSWLSYFPGGLMLQTANTPYNLQTAMLCIGIGVFLLLVVVFDHYNKTKEGLLNPSIKVQKAENGKLWKFLRKWLGHNAGKYYYYVLTHPYNRIQFLTIALIPAVYIPLLLQFEYGSVAAILIPTMLAAIPVALLAMGMANMYGYEHRELLLHLQFPESFEKQLKERFLGIITVPLFIFYLITAAEVALLPEFGSVWSMLISNTFFFLCFMLLFVWSSSFQYQKAIYSSFSYKHPIFSQKVTFVMSFMIFMLGYTVFVPLGEFETYRLSVMGILIVAIGSYLWMHVELLANLFNGRVLNKLWNDH